MQLIWQKVSIHFIPTSSLADDLIVGMGKTIMLSALIQTARGPEEPEASANNSAKSRQLRLDKSFRPARKQTPQQSKGPYATLIVAPTSLITQWAEELKRSSKPGTLKILVWHGHSRLDLETAMEGDDAVDVVITSYGTLVSEHAKLEKSGSPVFDGGPSKLNSTF